MSNLCGFFCLAFIYFLNISKFRTKNIIYDASIYIDLFEDLDKVNDVFKNEYVLSLFFTDEHSEQARAPHTNGPRDVPRCGALSSSSKYAALQGGMMVVLMPLFAAALIVCPRYFIVAPSPFPAAQLVVHRR